MNNIITTLFLILLFLTGKSYAYDPVEGQVTATLGPYYSRTNYAGFNSDINSSFKGGTGLIAVGDFNDHASLEISMFYIPQTFFREFEGYRIAEKTQIMHIGMGYRRWLSPYLSTSLAFYSSYSMGVIDTIYTDVPVGVDVDTSARDITEYGLDLSLQGDLWSSEHDKWAVVLEGRYSLSLTSKRGEKSDQYGGMIGLRYMVQEEKQVIAPPPVK
jgi:hypothetical protein